jgi:hypothetical protein
MPAPTKLGGPIEQGETPVARNLGRASPSIAKLARIYKSAFS